MQLKNCLITLKRQVNIKGWVLLLILTTVVGCSTPTPEPTTIDESEFKVDIPKPQPVSLREVDWKVINTKSGTYFALTTKEYEELSLNMQELLRFLRESKAYIKAIEDGRGK